MFHIELVFTFIWLALITIEVLINFWIIMHDEEEIKHKKRTWIRILVALGLNILYAYSNGYWLSIEFGLFQWISFAFIFPPFLNALRKKPNPFLYLDTTPPVPWYDKQLAKLTPPQLQGYQFLLFLLMWMSFDIHLVKFSGFVEQVVGTYNWNNWIW